MDRLTRRNFGVAVAGLFIGAAVFVSPANAQGNDELNNVVLRIGDQVGATRARLEAAGLLDDVPYEIEWSVYPAAVHLHEALKAHAIDVGGAADSPTVSAIAGGSPIKIVANFRNGGLGSSIIVPADSPIQTIEDLAGKTISPSTRGSIAHYLTLGVLDQAGLSPDDVTLAFLTPVDASAAFQAGNVDAWATWGIYVARSIGQLGARVLIDGVGINTGDHVFSATDAALADPGKSAAIADYADRVERSYEWVQQNKEDWIAFYADFSRQSPEIVAEIYPHEAAHERIALDAGFADSLQNVFDTWVEAGVLSGELDLSQYIHSDLATGH